MASDEAREHTVTAEAIQGDACRAFEEQSRFIEEALKQGVREAMLRHKAAGLPVVIYRDGKTVWVMPEELGY